MSLPLEYPDISRTESCFCPDAHAARGAQSD
jgi:hypothetical protein